MIFNNNRLLYLENEIQQLGVLRNNEFAICEECGGVFLREKMHEVRETAQTFSITGEFKLRTHDFISKTYYCQAHKKNYDLIKRIGGQKKYIKLNVPVDEDGKIKK